VTHTPYSGMLPGLVSGFYAYDEVHIDLRKLCSFAGARFLQGKCHQLDLNSKRVLCEGLLPVRFDILSMDIGSTPAVADIVGAREIAIAAKPVSRFLEWWEKFKTLEPKYTITVVGGGAGGVELCLSMRTALGKGVRFNLVHQGSEILQTHNRVVRRKMTKLLMQRGIHLYLNSDVKEVKHDSVVTHKDEIIGSDYTVWVTHASAPKWLEKTGLALDPKGFIEVAQTLQSVSHPELFAVGDIASMKSHPMPKSGVYAVREAAPLLRNIRALAEGRSLTKYRPQRHFLSLIGTGTQEAVASKGLFAWQSKKMWQWKDTIDRRFMGQFQDLPSGP